MDEDLSELERLEAAKKWWHENYKSILLGAAIAVVVVGGWRYWQYRTQLRNEAASALFTDLETAMQKHDQAGALKTGADGRARAEAFRGPGEHLPGRLLIKLRIQGADLRGSKRRLGGADSGGGIGSGIGHVYFSTAAGATASFRMTRSQKSPKRSAPMRSLTKRVKTGRSSLTMSSPLTLSLKRRLRRVLPWLPPR